jgi:proteic killer suppression protein
MPIALVFADLRIRELCERQKLAESKIGIQAARRLRARLADIQAARSMADVTAGRPEHPRGSDRISFLLHPPYRLVLEPANEPIPRKKGGDVQWSKVDSVRVIYVGEYP